MGEPEAKTVIIEEKSLENWDAMEEYLEAWQKEAELEHRIFDCRFLMVVCLIIICLIRLFFPESLAVY